MDRRGARGASCRQGGKGGGLGGGENRASPPRTGTGPARPRARGALRAGRTRRGRRMDRRDARGASCRQERTGGALGGGKNRASALRTGTGSTGRAARASLVARRSATERRPLNGAVRKWQSAQSGG